MTLTAPVEASGPCPVCFGDRKPGYMMCRACWRRVRAQTKVSVYRAAKRLRHSLRDTVPQRSTKVAAENYATIRAQAIREATP